MVLILQEKKVNRIYGKLNKNIWEGNPFFKKIQFKIFFSKNKFLLKFRVIDHLFVIMKTLGHLSDI